MESRDLQALMARYQAGDAKAFDALFAALEGPVFGWLLKKVRNREAAEDLFQDVFTRIHRHRDTWLPGSPVMPWVFAIARNAAIDRGRRAARSREEAVEDVDAIPGPASETGGEMGDALARLPAAHRDVLVLTKVEGLTAPEAAAVLGTTPGAVKLRVHRAMGKLRELLGVDGEEDER